MSIISKSEVMDASIILKNDVKPAKEKKKELKVKRGLTTDVLKKELSTDLVLPEKKRS